MSRRAAYFALGMLGAIFVLGVGQLFLDPNCQVIPEQIVRLAIAILSGVAIGAILTALRADNGEYGGT
jgi:hypothetical protein